MEPEKNQYNIRKLLLQQVLIMLKEEYDSQTFNMNECVRTATDSILVDDVTQRTSEELPTIQILYQQLLNIVFVLGKSPSIWIQLLQRDEIHAQDNEVVISKSQVLTKIYRKISRQIQQKLDQIKSKNKLTQVKFEDEYVDQKVMFLFAQFLTSVAMQICQIYEKGVNFIKSQIQQIEKQLKKSKIMNSYLLFSILKQQSTLIQKQIQLQLSEGMFRNVQNAHTQFFSVYTMKNFERLKLVCNLTIDPYIFTKQQQEIMKKQTAQNWLKYLDKHKNLTLKRLANKNGQQAILVLDQQNKKQDEELPTGIIIQVLDQKQIKVVNSQTTQKSWYAVDMGQSFQQLRKLTVISSSQKVQHQLIQSAVPLDAYATVGGNLGKCLAGINDYGNANQFLKDLTKKTVVSGSTMYLMMEIPILNYFFIAGGFTYSFYQAFSNQATNNPKKFKKFGQATASAVGTAGTSIAGMVIGQALIPVPVVGAFIGGVIGGFIGEKGTKSITSALQKNQFKQLIGYLKKKVQAGGYWHYSGQLLDQLGINSQFFQKNNPIKEGSKSYWMTAICFCVVSFYESKRYAEFNKKKLKQLQKQKSNKKITGDDQVYKNQFDLVAITNFLTSHSLWLNENVKNLEYSIKHLIIH